MNWQLTYGEDPRAESPEPLCECGHERDAHEHYRRGLECSLCGAEVCTEFGSSRGTASE
jgi:hypothetical protein